MTSTRDAQLNRFIADMFVAMTRIIKSTRHMDGLADKHELTQPQIFTLWQLRENGPTTMGELSELLSVTHGVATRMVDRLLKKGMVERRRDKNDRRVVCISLSRLGEEATDQAVADFMAVVKDVFRDVPQHDRDEYLALMARIEKAQAGEHGEQKSGGPIH
jgi:DNA-binding MarR family transcriptional regulator